VLAPQCHDLGELDIDLTDEEIKQTVMQAPMEKAPGPDGYINVFDKASWEIIKSDITTALWEMFALGASCWNLLNTANIALIAKKKEAQAMGDYRPISIMHSMAKLLGKILAT
jgi:hypothetical protein